MCIGSCMKQSYFPLKRSSHIYSLSGSCWSLPSVMNPFKSNKTNTGRLSDHPGFVYNDDIMTEGTSKEAFGRSEGTSNDRRD